MQNLNRTLVRDIAHLFVSARDILSLTSSCRAFNTALGNNVAPYVRGLECMPHELASFTAVFPNLRDITITDYNLSDSCQLTLPETLERLSISLIHGRATWSIANLPRCLRAVYLCYEVDAWDEVERVDCSNIFAGAHIHPNISLEYFECRNVYCYPLLSLALRNAAKLRILILHNTNTVFDELVREYHADLRQLTHLWADFVGNETIERLRDIAQIVTQPIVSADYHALNRFANFRDLCVYSVNNLAFLRALAHIGFDVRCHADIGAQMGDYEQSRDIIIGSRNTFISIQKMGFVELPHAMRVEPAKHACGTYFGLQKLRPCFVAQAPGAW